ncbi:Bestrophin-1 [Vespula squamosa]|uniref:Bestrophin homolog n=1 Tax=Vespula squamosa TaxID=30214 RepID=A0ABD2BGA9_VESSQ
MLPGNVNSIFEKIRYYFGNSSESIPMSFVLGFYVSLVVKRWWEQYKLLPWPDNLALFISAAIPGNDERGRLMRRNIVRYAVLAYVITLQRISLRVKRRFPTLQHIVDVAHGLNRVASGLRLLFMLVNNLISSVKKIIFVEALLRVECSSILRSNASYLRQY